MSYDSDEKNVSDNTYDVEDYEDNKDIMENMIIQDGPIRTLLLIFASNKKICNRYISLNLQMRRTAEIRGKLLRIDKVVSFCVPGCESGEIEKEKKKKFLFIFFFNTRINSVVSKFKQ